MRVTESMVKAEFTRVQHAMRLVGVEHTVHHWGEHGTVTLTADDLALYHGASWRIVFIGPGGGHSTAAEWDLGTSSREAYATLRGMRIGAMAALDGTL